MIECPICQVMNEETALFCAECGQRFGPSISKDGGGVDDLMDDQAPPSFTNKPARLKLHSPMLGGGGGADAADDPSYAAGYEKPQMSKLRGAPAPRTYEEEIPNPGVGHPAPRKHLLRSPLLGGDDDGGMDYDDDDDDSPEVKPGGLRSPMLGSSGKPKGGRLRSPLLGDDDDDDAPGSYGSPPPSGEPKKKGGFRSPLLGDSTRHYDDDEAPRGQHSPRQGKQRLHSPMLDGDEEEPMEDSHRTGGRPAGKPKLHSPMLGGGGGGVSYDDDPVDDSHRTGGRPAGKPKLHSPMLGGGGGGVSYDDDHEDHRTGGRQAGKPKLHSPMLGGGGGGVSYDDDHEDHRTGGRPAGKPKLHSPILGGGGDYEDDDELPRGAKRPFSPARKLHSPMLGGADEYDEDDGADDVDDENQPVLRSPLLGAMSKRRNVLDRHGSPSQEMNAPQGVQVHKTEHQSAGFPPAPESFLQPPTHPSSQAEPPRNFLPPQPSLADLSLPDLGSAPSLSPPPRLQPPLPAESSPPPAIGSPFPHDGLSPPLPDEALAPPLPQIPSAPPAPPLLDGPLHQGINISPPPEPGAPIQRPPEFQSPPDFQSPPSFQTPPNFQSLPEFQSPPDFQSPPNFQAPPDFQSPNFQPLEEAAGYTGHQSASPSAPPSFSGPSLDALGHLPIEFGVPSHPVDGLPYVQSQLHPPGQPSSPPPEFRQQEPPPERLLSSNRQPFGTPLSDTNVDRPFSETESAPHEVVLERPHINKEQGSSIEGTHSEPAGLGRTNPDVVDFVPPLPFEETRSLTSHNMGLGRIEQEPDELEIEERRNPKTDRRRKDRRMVSPLLGGGGSQSDSWEDDEEEDRSTLPNRRDMNQAPGPRAQGPVMITVACAIVGLIAKAFFLVNANAAWAGVAMPAWFWIDQIVTPLALLLCLIMAVAGGRRS